MKHNKGETQQNPLQTWHFQALDTLFFRESRPMDSQGNSLLGSLFPPSVRTFIGAVRTALGEANGVDWRDYRTQQKHPLTQLIGYGDDFASLKFSGVWIYKKGKRLYPAPQNIMCKNPPKHSVSKLKKVFFLSIADTLTHCDLGRVRLPALAPEDAGSKPLENIWLTEDEMNNVLAGYPPKPAKWVTLRDLLVEEPRIGIARDNQTRGVEKSRLYQTSHVRLAGDVNLAIDIDGLESVNKNHDDDNDAETTQKWNTTAPSLLRLGGEGRHASISVTHTNHTLNASCTTIKIATQNTKTVKYSQFALYLLTPLLINPNSEHWQPLPDFSKSNLGKQTIWKGKINEIPVTLHTAITGKAHREGAWDLAKNKPKAVQSYTPAGSVFYCTSRVSAEEIINELHGVQIGEETALGRGKLAVGQWV